MSKLRCFEFEILFQKKKYLTTDGLIQITRKLNRSIG
jgi:hypothetical protein